MEGVGQFIAVVAIVSLPAASVNLVHRLTGNPFLNPLGITQESLAEYGEESDSLSIGIYVDWGRDRPETPDRAEVGEYISDAISGRASDFFIVFRDVPGTEVEITLVVGPNRYGPYPPSRLIEGIVPATVALEMTRRARG